MATIGFCEQTIASCQGPASRNGIATLLTTKGVKPDNGGIGNQWFVDRAGIHARHSRRMAIRSPRSGSGMLPFQTPRVVVPAGMSDFVYEPRYSLNATKTNYTSELAPNTPKTTLAHPMPIAVTFFAGQGEEPTLIKIGTAYEVATHRRTQPPACGPVSSRGGTTGQRR